MRKVNLFCVGYEKSGTTWLFQQLKNHDEVFIPESKEVHYFNVESIHDPNVPNPNYHYTADWYHKHYSGAKKTDKYLADFTPGYVWSTTAAKKIYDYNPEAKIVILIRDPIDKLESLINFYFQQGNFKKESFTKILKKYPNIIWRSMYYKHILKYYNLFPKHNILILKFDDLKNEPDVLLENISRFLKIKNIFSKDNYKKKSNVTRPIKYPIVSRVLQNVRSFVRTIERNGNITKILRAFKLDKLYTGIIRANYGKNEELKKMKFSTKYSEQLWNTFFKDDIQKLEKLADISLNEWKA